MSQKLLFRNRQHYLNKKFQTRRLRIQFINKLNIFFKNKNTG